VMKILVMVFWVVILYSDAVGHVVLWNIGIQSHHYMVSQPRRLWLESRL